MGKKFTVAAMLAGLVLTGATAWGQEETRARAGANELDTIIVTADRVPTPAREVSQNVTVISEEEIKKSAANDVADLLKQKGIQVYYDGAEGYGNEGLVVRGGRSSMHGFDIAGDILILVDGHRSGTDSMSHLELANISRIEIIRGPGAVQYGSAAMGGVVNLITKRGGEQTKAQVELGLGSWNERRSKGFLSGQAGQLDYALGASYYTRDDYHIGGDGGRYENSDLGSRTRYSANLGWNFWDDRHRLGFIGQGSDTKDAGKGEDGRDTRQNRNNYNLDFSYDGRSEDEARSWLARYFRGYVGYDLNRTRTAASLPTDRAQQTDNDNDYQGAQAQFGWDLGLFEFVGGVDWMSYEFDQRQMGEAATAGQRNMAQSEFDNIGGFFLGKVHLLEDRNLTLSAGLRYDEFDVSVDAYRQSTNNRAHTNQTRDTWNPSLGLAYSPADFLKLRTNYAQAFKMPLPRQLAGYTVMAVTPFIGNPDLQPEESDNWDAGLDLEYEALSFSATYFLSQYKNMINYQYHPSDAHFSSGNGNHFWYFNQERATVNGLEFGLSFDLGEHFDLGFRLAPYAYWTRLLKFEDGNGWKLANRARDTLSTGLKFDHEPWGLTVNLDATYYGTQYGTTRSAATNNTAGTISADYEISDVGRATVWDMNASKRLYHNDRFGDVSAKMALKNIFDKKYTTNEDGWMPGASVYFGLVWDY